MSKLITALLVAVALVVAGCGQGNESPVSTTSLAPVGTTPTTSGSTPTTAADTGATATGAATQEAAANALVAAWKEGNRGKASQYADAAAVSALFRISYQSEAAAPQLVGCDRNPGFENRDTCSFQYPGGSMHMIMKTAGDAWRVERIEYVAD